VSTSARMALTAGRTQLLLGNFPMEAHMKVAASQARHLEEVALPRLLAIAADAQDRAVLQDALEAEAYEIVFWDSLGRLEQSVLEQDTPFDAIVIELFSPVEIFFDLIPTIKARSPHTEVIFISRLADEDLWIESIQRGAYDLLPKPLDRNELQRIVTNALTRSRAASGWSTPRVVC
jgi:DNA-binding NtrC family response regulator